MLAGGAWLTTPLTPDGRKLLGVQKLVEESRTLELQRSECSPQLAYLLLQCLQVSASPMVHRVPSTRTRKC